MTSAFEQPPVPGYSPWPTARQDSDFLRTPGVQGLQEGVSQGQGLGFTPQQEFFSEGTEGTAPPSSVAVKGSNMWSNFGGSGGAPSSLAPGGNNPMVPTMSQLDQQIGNQLAPSMNQLDQQIGNMRTGIMDSLPPGMTMPAGAANAVQTAGQPALNNAMNLVQSLQGGSL